MDNDKTSEYENLEAQGEKDEEAGNDSAPRARNRTVMLTPEMTGQVRARLAQEMGKPKIEHKEAKSEPKEAEPTTGSTTGFYTPAAKSKEDSKVEYHGARAEKRDSIDRTPTQREMSSPIAAREQAPRGAKEEGVTYAKIGKIIGFLVSFDKNPNGDVFELRTGRFIVTCEPSSNSNCIVIKDESISPMHAIVRVTEEGEIQVLDQLSEFGTKIKCFGSNKQEALSGDKSALEHGDVVWFGKREFQVCILASLKAK